MTEWEIETLSENFIHIRRITPVLDEGYIVASTPWIENAEQIVREHNAHDPLLAGVEDVIDYFSDHEDWDDMLSDPHPDNFLGAMLRGLIAARDKAKAEEVGRE